MTRPTHAPAQTLGLIFANSLTATFGAQEGDGLSFAAELVLDDIYQLSAPADWQQLTLVPLSSSAFLIEDGSETGVSGARVHLDCCATFAGPDGQLFDILILVEIDDTAFVKTIYAYPLQELPIKTDLRLMRIDKDRKSEKFAQVACSSFTAGTRITLAGGAQCLIQDLEVGDMVLTRDNGPQKIRWIGKHLTRAIGIFAPIRISAGALHNTHDLIMSPDHRLFIYQRTDRVGLGRAEVLVKARHLVNGDTVTVMQGGFVEYVQLLFDRHQLIYAEGIAAETMLVDSFSLPLLPNPMARRYRSELATSGQAELAAFETTVHPGADEDTADLLRDASTS